MGALVPLILQGLTVLPGIFTAIKTLFGSTKPTPAQTADAATAIASSVIGVVGSASKGGQAQEMQKAQSALQPFHDVLQSLMNLVETTGASGTDKQGFVSTLMTSALQGYEKMVNPTQAATAETDIKPIVNGVIDDLVPIMFQNSAASSPVTQAATQ